MSEVPSHAVLLTIRKVGQVYLKDPSWSRQRMPQLYLKGLATRQGFFSGLAVPLGSRQLGESTWNPGRPGCFSCTAIS